MTDTYATLWVPRANVRTDPFGCRRLVSGDGR